MYNLDTLAAQCAQKVVYTLVPEGVAEAQKKAAALDNMATKALGVLQENGVYAGMLFLYSKGNDPNAQSLRENLLDMLGHPEMAPLELTLPDAQTRCTWLDVSQHLTANVCADLDTLLLVKQVWEQTLIYVRYGVKAREDKK